MVAKGDLMRNIQIFDVIANYDVDGKTFKYVHMCGSYKEALLVKYEIEKKGTYYTIKIKKIK